ncbi:ABC transporter substrate-binding protein [Dehalobacter sp. DCM]|uniref:ABC transporter substrate-binding protein n=1 Tax=Dehalobacter sp. DCM TaxID=2907827 RepID=UPI003081CA40|nr:ABC transporter substrate-binding protein [Dehalobacter sp. DCM]
MSTLIHRRWFCIMMVILLLGAFSLLMEGCIGKKPILIGFSAQLTGRQSELGVQERNGVQLAVETINAKGGVAGHKIDLIVRDDFGIPEKAKEADQELIKAGVLAIIGHATTAQTVAGLEVTNPANVIMLSPTVSSPKLSGLDDYFFRVYPSFKNSAQAFAQYTCQRDGITKLAVIYDLDNAAYAKTYSTAFVEKYQAIGGKITKELSFSSTAQPDFAPLLLKLRESKADGLLIIASDIDTALIAQRARLMDWKAPLYTSAWAQTETLIINGGQAVEGLKLEQSYAMSSQSPALLDFQSRYQARFGKAPSFGAVFSYEAALALAAALEKTGGKAKGLRQALTEIRNFQGLMDTFSFDQYGDVARPFYLSTIRDGKFIILEKMTLN